LLCLQASDGAMLWERELRATGRTMAHEKTAVAACTPCSDGRHIFALWSSNDVAAFDLEGNLLWLRDLPRITQTRATASAWHPRRL
jgi:outer membrane protein assembly factor BamB